jgi:N-acetylneuraminic acid mutarotase
MVVWGGYDGAYTNTGGVYDPGSDTWTATSMTNAPMGREWHTAVWTGSRMIVWGGTRWTASGESYLNTGAAYDSTTDTWTPISMTNAPAGRTDHTAIWTGSSMIIWGGRVGEERLNTGGVYDPATDTWTATSTTNAPTRRYAHTAVWTGSAMIVWGGDTGVDFDNDTGGLYDPVTDTWTTTSTTNTPPGSQGHSAAWTGSKMVVWGGFGDYG